MPDDLRLIVARRMVWENEVWREPARIFRAIGTMKEIVADGTATRESRAEAEYLIKRLYSAAKSPALPYTNT